MPTLQKIYSDLDLTFGRKPGSNDVTLSYDEKAVLRSIRNLLLTQHYDRLFNPELGSKVSYILFEPISPLTASQLEDQIRITIENFEPRVKIDTIRVQASDEQNGYNVTLRFYIENATLLTSTTLFLERIK
jgi:hypothetical protein